MPDDGLGQKRDVTYPAHVPFVNAEAFWAPEVAVNKGRVKLHRQAIVNSVAEDELRDRTFQTLPSGISNLTVVELKRAKMGELLSDGSVEPGQGNFLFRHRFHLR